MYTCGVVHDFHHLLLNFRSPTSFTSAGLLKHDMLRDAYCCQENNCHQFYIYEYKAIVSMIE